MKKWNFYTSNELKPQGWLKKQLEIQANGLAGNLDKVWPDVRDSAWIGGTAEGWERVPYWLDGFIPLAYLLENEDMIARARKYIDAIIASQKPDGWICPCEEEAIPKYDTWAVLLITKVLTNYYECSKDARIPGIIYKALKNYYTLLSCGKIKLFAWGKYRWFEGFIAIRFLYGRYREDWILELAKILKEQGTDYAQKTELWKRPLNKWTLDTHIVNLAMMLKSEAVSCDHLNSEYTDQAEALYQILYSYNGTPAGLFTGDECLSGLSPIQGTELCSVAELMYSYELLYAYTGDKKWAERLEVVAFNALPATISDDMWTHQYVQMSNQISCEKFPGRSLFRTNNGEAHLFGLEPHFGCCTANFGQAWPKLMLSAFLHKDSTLPVDTVLSALPIPGTLKTEDMEITLETNYPFENELVYQIAARKAFDLKVRVPSFAKNIVVSGKIFTTDELTDTSALRKKCELPAQIYKTPEFMTDEELIFHIQAGTRQTIHISFQTTVQLTKRPHNLYSVKCGSLVFSLPIKYEKVMHEYEKNGVERKYPYCDYEYVGRSDWNYGICVDESVSDALCGNTDCDIIPVADSLKVVRRGVDEIPFSSERPPVVLAVKVRKVEWDLADGFETVCDISPASTTPISEEETLEFYPYGCAKLRMTELPVLADR